MFNLQYTFTEQSNKFHTLASLTNWHFSARKDLNEYLVERYGPLSETQKEAIDRFGKILGRKASGSDFIGGIFFEDNFKFEYQEFEKIISMGQFGELQAVFDMLDSWWQKVWSGEKSKLEAWKEKLEQEKTHQQSQSIIADLESFYGHNPNSKQTVFLLVSAFGNSGGGVNIGEDKITLECGGRDPAKNLDTVLGTLWHEVAHIFAKPFESTLNHYIEKADIGFLDNSKLMEITGGFRVPNYFREAAIYCLFPNGYLGQKYLGLTPVGKAYETIFEKKVSKAPLVWKWSILVSHNLSFIASRYIEQCKNIDKQFLAEIEKTLKEFAAFVERN